MSTPSLFFGGAVSQNYEEYLGPFLFEPFAAALAARLDFSNVTSVLELACGSGRLTKHIADTLPPEVEFTATDLNADMIEIAKSKVSSESVTWTRADMMELPFGNESFDLIICQFGIMLVPDQNKALAEIYRVLRPGGKLIFNTWTDRPYNRIWALADEVLSAFLGANRIGGSNGPFSLSDEKKIHDLLQKAEFSAADMTVVETTGIIESAANAVYGFVFGLPIAAAIQKERPEYLQQILITLEERLKAELGDQPLRAPQKALFIEAMK